MNGKLLILLVSVTATVGLSGCTAINCPAEFARPKSRELLCGATGNVMSTGSEVYITPAQYQEWKRQTTPMYGGGVPPMSGGSSYPQSSPMMAPMTSPTPPMLAPTAPEMLAPSTSQRPLNRAIEQPADLIEG